MADATRNKKSCAHGLDSEGCLGVLSDHTKEEGQNRPALDHVVCFPSTDEPGLVATRCGKGRTVFRDDVNERTASHCCTLD